MIIKDITINNFRSYYGSNHFELSEGLTLIIGDNGDGKTTFFEALEWLFDLTDYSNQYASLSEKRSSELRKDESEELSVEITFEHDGIKVLRKSMQFKKDSNNLVTPIRDSISLRGFKVVGSERYSIDGKELLTNCFDTYLQKYCLFKGEDALKILDNDEALSKLVDTFSDLTSFNQFVDITESFLKKSNRALVNETSKASKESSELKTLTQSIETTKSEIARLESEIQKNEDASSTYDKKLNRIVVSEELRERYQILNDRIKNKKDDLTVTVRKAKDDFNRRLLDDMWVLCAFPDIFKEFSEKVHRLSLRKRQEHDDYISHKSKEEGKLEGLEEVGIQLANGEPALPWYLPKEEILSEMIEAHICKVCNRPFNEGDSAHQYLLAKLNNYRKHIEQKRKEQEEKVKSIKPIFKYDYVEQLDNFASSMSGTDERTVSNLVNVISDRIAEIRKLKEKINKLSADVQAAEDDKARLLMQNDGISEDDINNGISEYRAFNQQKEKIDKKVSEDKNQLRLLEAKLNGLIEEYKEKSPGSYQIKLHQEVSNVFEMIYQAFSTAKTENLRRFLNELQLKANEYFDNLNENDFHGEIRIEKNRKDEAEIKLYSSNGTEIKDPGGAQETTMHMSVLFAISDLTTRKKEEDYPLIFDAPTSSFGEFKEDVFYNIIDGLEKQCVIVTKDLLEYNPLTGMRNLNENKINELHCSIYRIQKAENFDKNDLSTVRTIVSKIK